jgi:VTC domain
MYSSASAETWLAGAFRPLSLDDLNAKAAMLERLDNKYVINTEVLRKSIADLGEVFDVLEIDGKRSFHYDTRYFDGPGLECYFNHHQGRRKRCKVRVRTYADAGLCYLEVKLKDKRGVTVKKRKKCQRRAYAELPRELMSFVDGCHEDLYASPLPFRLGPSLDIAYRRITLVAREGGERLTIDGGLEFVRDEQHERIDDDLFIVETKSRNGNGLADKVFRSLHQHPANSCSKYCTGLAMTEAALRSNKFKSTMIKMGWKCS